MRAAAAAAAAAERAWQSDASAAVVSRTCGTAGAGARDRLHGVRVAGERIHLVCCAAAGSLRERHVPHAQLPVLRCDTTCAAALRSCTRLTLRAVALNVSTAFPSTTYIYYELTNFYQNYRQYVKSVDDSQLNGAPVSSVSSSCSPLTTGAGNLPYAPCGLIANSMFNDTLVLVSLPNNETVPVSGTGIAWSSDVSTKFQNPPGHNLTDAFAGTLPPPNWQQPI